MEHLEKYVNRIIEGECRRVMTGIPKGSIDMILTDPPFGISKEIKITRSKNAMKFKGSDINLDFGEWDKFEDTDEFMEFTYSWVDECDRVLKEGGILISYFDRDKINFLSRYLREMDYNLRGYFISAKVNPVPQARKVGFMSGWEECGIWRKGDTKHTFNWELGQQKDWMAVPIVGGKERTPHPTQKSLKVFKMLVSYWSKVGDVILDPFMGSGTTAVAAWLLQRKFIGIEKDEGYCEIANKRLDPYLNQKRLFGAE